ncbi:MAG: mannose-1-phosphate guanylyltransferase/mannose-6-phosphate isomerase [Burkholderiales bacterium]|nr:mannose-1-phosphate guanylyltransferase/mannose-6-phosphate isomerase [Burkholderiales bacterium]
MNISLSEAKASASDSVHARRYAVVLAGGSGTRLWPLSRTTMPKQLLCLNGAESLMQQTAKRLRPLVAPERTLTVTHQDHRFEVAGQLHAVDPRLAGNVLAEPAARNTLPAIAWAVACIARATPDALVGVFSSDHAIADEAAFLAAWTAAEAAAEQGFVVLFGMCPTEPKTGFGYIQAGQALSGPAGAAHLVRRFVEKPDRASAERFLADGGYFWNGGMFVFRADAFLALLETHQPAIFTAMRQLGECGNEAPAALYAGLPDISIDYGILEKADKVAVVPAAMGWSDLGSWEALYQQRGKDAAGNMLEGDVVAVDSRDNLLWSDHGTVATLGLENIAVVQTRDATLVCPRERTADLKSLVAKVKNTHRALTETHLTVSRPWGSYTVLEEGDRYKIKRIVVNPGQKLSMQMHHHRSEHWVVIAGTARIVNGDQEIYLEEDQSTYIPKTHRHRLENPGKIPLQIIEIQTGAYLEEDDIVRFGDIYGRA